MGMCMSFVLLMFLLPMLLITGSNSITSFTGLDNGCKDDGECVQGSEGTTPGSIHGFYPQGMEGSAAITCGCNLKSKLIIGFAGGLITLLFTSATFLVYKRNKKLEENELNERHADQLNELNERHAEQLNELKKRHAKQLNKSWGQRILSWLASNEWLLPLIINVLEAYAPMAKPFCRLLKSVPATAKATAQMIHGD